MKAIYKNKFTINKVVYLNNLITELSKMNEQNDYTLLNDDNGLIVEYIKNKGFLSYIYKLTFNLDNEMNLIFTDMEVYISYKENRVFYKLYKGDILSDIPYLNEVKAVGAICSFKMVVVSTFTIYKFNQLLNDFMSILINKPNQLLVPLYVLELNKGIKIDRVRNNIYKIKNEQGLYITYGDDNIYIISSKNNYLVEDLIDLPLYVGFHNRYTGITPLNINQLNELIEVLGECSPKHSKIYNILNAYVLPNKSTQQGIILNKYGKYQIIINNSFIELSLTNTLDQDEPFSERYYFDNRTESLQEVTFYYFIDKLKTFKLLGLLDN